MCLQCGRFGHEQLLCGGASTVAPSNPGVIPESSGSIEQTTHADSIVKDVTMGVPQSSQTAPRLDAQWNLVPPRWGRNFNPAQKQAPSTSWQQGNCYQSLLNATDGIQLETPNASHSVMPPLFSDAAVPESQAKTTSMHQRKSGHSAAVHVSKNTDNGKGKQAAKASTSVPEGFPPSAHSNTLMPNSVILTEKGLRIRSFSNISSPSTQFSFNVSQS